MVDTRVRSIGIGVELPSSLCKLVILNSLPLLISTKVHPIPKSRSDFSRLVLSPLL